MLKGVSREVQKNFHRTFDKNAFNKIELRRPLSRRMIEEDSLNLSKIPNTPKEIIASKI